jgi:hypothetical protein
MFAAQAVSKSDSFVKATEQIVRTLKVDGNEKLAGLGRTQ